MKNRYTNGIMAIAVTMLVLASCSKDLEINGPVELSFISETGLQMEGGADTRALTNATENQDTQFKNGESVAIFIFENATSPTYTYGTSGKVVYTANGSGGLTPSNPTDTKYWPSSGNGVNIYGFYPASVVTTRNGTAVSFTVQDDQSTDANYRASDLMWGIPNKYEDNSAASNPVARKDQAVNIKFTHLLTKINVVLAKGNGVTDAMLQSAVVQILNLQPTTSITPNAATVTAATASGTATAITMLTTASTSTSDNNGWKMSAIVVPQTAAASKNLISVKLNTATGGGTLYYKPTSAMELVAGKAYTFNITVNLTTLTVTSTVTDWISGGTTSGNATF